MEDLQPVSVLADHREKNPPLMARLTPDRRCELHTAILNPGDYLLDVTIPIERKTLPDLVASIRDGRFFSRASRPASANVAVLLEGVGRAEVRWRSRSLTGRFSGWNIVLVQPFVYRKSGFFEHNIVLCVVHPTRIRSCIKKQGCTVHKAGYVRK